jgi:hypothetical protein
MYMYFNYSFKNVHNTYRSFFTFFIIVSLGPHDNRPVSTNKGNTPAMHISTLENCWSNKENKHMKINVFLNLHFSSTSIKILWKQGSIELRCPAHACKLQKNLNLRQHIHQHNTNDQLFFEKENSRSVIHKQTKLKKSILVSCTTI